MSKFSKNNTYAPLILGIAILWAIFWCVPTFNTYSQNQTELTTVQQQKEQKQSEENLLNTLKEKNENNPFIEKVSKKFVESEILNAVMINDFTQSKWVQIRPRITISNIALDRGSKLPNGIFQGRVTITVSSDSVPPIVDYLNYLTTATPFAFTLTDISLPIDTSKEGIASLSSLSTTSQTVTVPVTLGVYYFQ